LRCTPFMLLFTVYQVLLWQRTGQDDLCVGIPVAGRDEVELEDLFGYFSGVLVLRGDLSGAPTVREAALRTRRCFMEAMSRQDIPFERLTAALDLPRDLSRTPLFQTMFTFHSTTSVGTTSSDGFTGLRADAFEVGAQHVKVDLALDVFTSATDMKVLLSYNTDLFDAVTVEAVADRFDALLHEVLAAPDAPITTLALTDAEQRDTLLRWGAGPQAPDTGTVTALVDRAAARTPEATALVSGATAVSYQELTVRAGELAARLAAAGVGAGQLVGLSLPRGVDLIAAMLAAWRLGAGYVPLDPDQPAARYAAMAADAGVAAIVTDGGQVTPAAGAGTVPEPAYVIFTSGSTGAPKPVLIGQQALATRVDWMTGGYGLTAADRVVQFAATGFDTHAEEIWPTLAAGASLVLLPDGPQSLPETMAADPAITVLDLPTAYWRSLLDLIDEIAWPPALRLVILGGEQVDADAVAVWRARFGDRVRLVNTYGPTEATIIATATDLGAADTGRTPPIGRPIAGVRVYVCDPDGRLVAPGVPGELCIAGPGLAHGYLGREELTAARFRPDPYGPGLLYRTGDLARWRVTDEPAQLEFLGRLDTQVKVRGIRVEPGEVEAVLRTHPQVTQAVVLAVDDALVAYTVGAATAAQVRAHAAGRLPGYLVPSTVVTLAALPLTRNGKLDVRALPAATGHRDETAPFIAPRTDAEQLVADVWAQVLSVEAIGAHDDFFDLGGHSLLATRVIARLRSAVRIDLPIRALFRHPTVAGLAGVIEDALIAEIDRLTDAEAAALTAGGPHHPGEVA
jgi:amino acid adenylation domain-containing protein